VLSSVPIGLIRYDPRTLSTNRADIHVLHPLRPRTGSFQPTAQVENSFWAKWRDASPQELGTLLGYSYLEGNATGGADTVRDRAFKRLWADMCAGKTKNWSGNFRTINLPPTPGYGCQPCCHHEAR